MKLAVPKEPRGAQLFVSWRHVDPGMVPWQKDGSSVGIWEAPPAATKGPTGPYGIRLEAVKPEITGPLLPMNRPWETNYNMYFDSVLLEDGMYRAWYTSVPANAEDRRGGTLPAHGHAVCYAESRDGMHWETPALGIYDYLGQPSNIVYGRELAPYGFQSGCIFRDPHGTEEERYKMFFLGIVPCEGDGETAREHYRDRFGDALDERIFAVKQGSLTATCMCGAVSPDGLHWTTIKEPVLAYCSDTLNTCYWDEGLQKYVAYIRMWRDGKRSVGRAESADFTHWTEPARVVLEADLSWNPCIDIYTNSRTAYPGSDERLMFPGIYDRFEDRRKVCMAVSEDEYSWNWVPGGPIADCGSAGDWDGGDLNPGIGMVFLGEEHVALPVMVNAEPHKYPRKSESSLGKPGWLVWPKGRLGAVTADQIGAFTTQIFKVNAPVLELNFETEPRMGEILIELQDADGIPIEGYTFEEAVPLSGNALAARVAWKEHPDLTKLMGKTVCMRIRMRVAKLYAYELKNHQL